MPRNPIPCYAALLLFLLLTLTGCLKRVEQITVNSDGSAKIRVTWEGDSRPEVYDGDAPPSKESGWNIVEERTETDADGNEKHFLVAERTTNPGGPLPDQFVRKGDAASKTCLKFPTTIQREKRDDGAYVHFRRVYPRREFSDLESWRRDIYNRDIQKIMEKERHLVTYDDRTQLVEAALQLEEARAIAFARDAFATVSPDLPQDRWLAVHTVMREAIRTVDADRLVRLMEGGDERLATEAQSLNTAVMKRLESTLSTACRYTPEQRRAFLDRFQRNKQYHEISEDLRDENFEIEVRMPGPIVASNANEVEGRVARWMFSAEAIISREVELMVTARLAD